MKNTPKTEKALATKWKCDTRTIRRWRKDRAPFNDDKAMRAWLTGRKNLPPGTAALLAESRREAVKVALPDIPQGERGAAHALSRAEETEAHFHQLLKVALRGGDVHEIKAAYKAWLTVSESLRRYDISVVNSRRTSEELIDKPTVEKLLYSLGWYFRMFDFGIYANAPSLVGLDDVLDVMAVLKAGRPVFDISVLAAARVQHPDFPEWMFTAFRNGITCTNPNAPERYKMLVEGFKVMMNLQIELAAVDMRAWLDARKVTYDRWRNETDPEKKSEIWSKECRPLRL